MVWLTGTTPATTAALPNEIRVDPATLIAVPREVAPGGTTSRSAERPRVRVFRQGSNTPTTVSESRDPRSPVFGSPIITKDAVSVAKEIELRDPLENMGAQMVREVASKTSDVAGDGTTATVLAQAISVKACER